MFIQSNHDTLNKKNILVIGRNLEILKKVTLLLVAEGYQVFGEHTNEGAMNTFIARAIDVVVIGGGVDVNSREFLHDFFTKQNPNIHIIDAHPTTILRQLQEIFYN